ncbi:MAG: hypothetical protein ABJC66_07810 [Gammaproteobacteria bacterium]
MGWRRHAFALIAALAMTAPVAIATPAAATAPGATASGTWTNNAPGADAAATNTAPADSAPANISPVNSPPANAPAANAAPTNAAPAGDIRDIRGPKGMFPLWLLLALLAGAALLVAGAYAAWRWSRRRQQPRPLTHLEMMLQRLEATRALMHPSTVREFSIAISDIVRGHIEYAFDVTATHRTTEEFLHHLLASSNAALAEHRGLLEEFLQRCDMAKFAGVTLSQQVMERLLESARRFVVESSKVAEATPNPQCPPGNAQEAHDSLPAT